jgi:hypothetical protein
MICRNAEKFYVEAIVRQSEKTNERLYIFLSFGEISNKLFMIFLLPQQIKLCFLSNDYTKHELGCDLFNNAYILYSYCPSNFSFVCSNVGKYFLES